jgi:hypothetical protein
VDQTYFADPASEPKIPAEHSLLNIQNYCSEYIFHILKAILNKNDEALKKVIEAKKPGAAKMATNFKNMPNLIPEAWNEKVSSQFMLYLTILKLSNQGFYDTVVNFIRFATEFLNVPFENIHIIENTDDKTWGNGMSKGPAPEPTEVQDDAYKLKYANSLFSVNAVEFMVKQKR